MSRKVSDNPADWNEEDLRYLFDRDQRSAEVRQRAEELGADINFGPEQAAPLVGRVGQLDPGDICPTCGQVVGGQEQVELGQGDLPPYSKWKRDELVQEADNRGLSYAQDAVKADLVQLLEDDDAAVNA